MKIIKTSHSLFIAICIIAISLTGCVNQQTKTSDISITDSHTQKIDSSIWTKREIAILNSLSINQRVIKNDKTNRVANHPDAIKLGQKLFFDTRLSENGNVSCATCHDPNKYFTDGLARSQGFGQTQRNAPTIVGASNDVWFFRDGREDSLWSQATNPIENPMEHRSSRNQFAHLIFNDVDLKNNYEKIFGPMPNISDTSRFPENAGPIPVKRLINAWKKMDERDREIINGIFVNGAKAIAAYETQLQPAPSRFDNYVDAMTQNKAINQKDSLSSTEIAGLKIFIDKGKCFICHNGSMFTDQSFHNIGTPPLNVKRYDFGRSKAVRRVKKNKFNCLSKYSDAMDKSCDELKYMVFHEEDTLGAFKTPGLRNVTKTAPYMHAGQYKSLRDVLKHYNEPPPTKIGMNKLFEIDLTKEELDQLEAFLKSLDSPIDAKTDLLKAVKK